MKDNFNLSRLRKPTKKQKINSRTKGNSFERKISKILNEHFEVDEFSRTPGSGAFATTHKLPEYLKIHGDIITPNKFKYCIECKKGYNKENLYSLYNDRSDFRNFLKQSEEDAEKAKKSPMLIYQQDSQPVLVVVRDIDLASIPQVIINMQEENKKYFIYKLEDLLRSTSKSDWFINY